MNLSQSTLPVQFSRKKSGKVPAGAEKLPCTSCQSVLAGKVTSAAFRVQASSR